jgi:hypothetical protein
MIEMVTVRKAVSKFFYKKMKKVLARISENRRVHSQFARRMVDEKRSPELNSIGAHRRLSPRLIKLHPIAMRALKILTMRELDTSFFALQTNSVYTH